MLYKAALKETKAVDTEAKSEEAPPHPYLLALGVLSIQKVRRRGREGGERGRGRGREGRGEVRVYIHVGVK